MIDAASDRVSRKACIYGMALPCEHSSICVLSHIN